MAKSWPKHWMHHVAQVLNPLFKKISSVQSLQDTIGGGSAPCLCLNEWVLIATWKNQLPLITLIDPGPTLVSTYPITFDLKKYRPPKGQQTGIHHTLKSVVVYKGGSVDKGHYVFLSSSACVPIPWDCWPKGVCTRRISTEFDTYLKLMSTKKVNCAVFSSQRESRVHNIRVDSIKNETSKKKKLPERANPPA